MARRSPTRGRLLGVPRLVLIGAAGLLVVLVVVIVVVATAGNGSSAGSAGSNAALCQTVGTQLSQQLSSTPLSEITYDATSFPQTAVSLLVQYETSYRQAAADAASNPALQQSLITIASDASFASTDLSTGYGNSAADIAKLKADISATDKTCGIAPPFAQ
jgi:hypothetical protein